MYEKENFYTILAKGFIVKEEGGLAYHRVHTFYENCLKFWIQVVLTNLNHGGFFARGNLPLPFCIGQ